jgi:transcriptional regulator with XRE-family HTH domain
MTREKESTVMRHEQAETVKTIGVRMRAARELCNLSLMAAAKRLGYSNPSKLSKVELASNSKTVPLWLLVRASREYEVSIDYLFGITDDWEIGARMTQERETSSWVFNAWERTRQRDMTILKQLNDRIQVIGEAMATMLEANSEAMYALNRFSELNPKFQDMKSGGRLINSVERAYDAANAVKNKMTKFKMECSPFQNRQEQMPLPLALVTSSTNNHHGGR